MEELECPKHDGTSTEHSLIEAWLESFIKRVVSRFTSWFGFLHTVTC
jgi:hypothetical protein